MFTLLPYIVYVVVFLAMCAALITIVHRSIRAEDARQRAIEAAASQAPAARRPMDRAA